MGWRIWTTSTAKPSTPITRQAEPKTCHPSNPRRRIQCQKRLLSRGCTARPPFPCRSLLFTRSGPSEASEKAPFPSSSCQGRRLPVDSGDQTFGAVQGREGICPGERGSSPPLKRRLPHCLQARFARSEGRRPPLRNTASSRRSRPHSRGARGSKYCRRSTDSCLGATNR